MAPVGSLVGMVRSLSLCLVVCVVGGSGGKKGGEERSGAILSGKSVRPYVRRRRRPFPQDLMSKSRNQQKLSSFSSSSFPSLSPISFRAAAAFLLSFLLWTGGRRRRRCAEYKLLISAFSGRSEKALLLGDLFWLLRWLSPPLPLPLVL